MRVSTRLVLLCGFSLSLPTLSFGQAVGLAAAGAPAANPGYAQLSPVNVGSLPAGYSLSGLTFDAVTGAVIGGAAGKATITANTNAVGQAGNDDNFAIGNARPNVSSIDGLSSIATFDGAFVAQAGPSAGGDYRFTMIGNDPKLGGTTV